MHIKSFLLGLLLLVASTVLLADPMEIKVVTDEWVGYSSKDGRGLYFDVMDAVFKPLGYKISVQFMPHSRATASVRRGEADVVMGVYANFFPDINYSKYPVEFESVDAAFREETYQQWLQTKSLANLTVAARYGAFLDDYYDVGDKYMELRTQDAMIKMLVSKRIDVALNYVRELKTAIEKNKARGIVIHESIFQLPAYFIFANTPEAQKLKHIFDENMKKIIADGRLKQMVMDNLGDEKYYPDFSGYKLNQ